MSAPLPRPGDRALGPIARAGLALDRVDVHRLLLASVLCGALALAGASIQRSRAVIANLGQRTRVAVATRELAPGAVITSADFHWTAWPTGLIPPGTQDLVVEGTLVRSRVAPGEPILASSLLGPASSASAALGPAERAVAIPLPLAPPPVRPGDLVDLVGIRAAFGTDDDRQLLQSVRLGRGRVVSVDDRSITVAVDETRAVAIVEHVAAGSVEIVMTPFEE